MVGWAVKVDLETGKFKSTKLNPKWINGGIQHLIIKSYLLIDKIMLLYSFYSKQEIPYLIIIFTQAVLGNAHQLLHTCFQFKV